MILWNALDFGFLRVAPAIAVNLIDMNLDVRTTSGVAAVDNVDILAPIPMPMLQVALDLGVVGATIEGGGISVNLHDAGGTYWDVEGMLRAKPWKHCELFAGYRWIKLNARGKADGQDFDADLNVQGWTIGGGFSF